MLIKVLASMRMAIRTSHHGHHKKERVEERGRGRGGVEEERAVLCQEGIKVH